MHTQKTENPSYKQVYPIWHHQYLAGSSANVEIISQQYAQLMLYFPKTQRRLALGKVQGSEYVSVCRGVYQLKDKVLVMTCLEHTRGASHHDFETFLLDDCGNVLFSQAIQADTSVVCSDTHFYLIVYPRVYLSSEYQAPVLHLYEFELDTLACKETPIEPPEALRMFFTNQYIRLLSAKWLISDEKTAIVCQPWLHQQAIKDDNFPSLHFEYVL